MYYLHSPISVVVIQNNYIYTGVLGSILTLNMFADINEIKGVKKSELRVKDNSEEVE